MRRERKPQRCFLQRARVLASRQKLSEMSHRTIFFSSTTRIGIGTSPSIFQLIENAQNEEPRVEFVPLRSLHQETFIAVTNLVTKITTYRIFFFLLHHADEIPT